MVDGLHSENLWPGDNPSCDRPSNLSLWRWLTYWFLTVVAISVARFEIIGSPPYFDFAMGFFTEANFLVESGFNYRLLNQQPYGLDGGPNCYLISVLPTMLAVSMIALPSARAVLVLWHLAAFALGALILVLITSLLRTRIGWQLALTCAAAVITTPMFLVQVDMVGMELPMIAAAVLAVVLATRRHFVAAVGASFTAFLMKPSGSLVTLALVVYLAGWLAARLVARGVDWRASRRELVGLATSIGFFLIELAMYRLSPNEAHVAGQGHGSNFPAYLLTVAPDLLIITCITGLWSLAHGYRWLRRELSSRPAAESRRLARAIERGLAAAPGEWFAWTLCLGNLVAIGYYIRVYAPRYLVLTIPLIYLIIGFRLTPCSVAVRRCGFLLLALLISFNLLNLNGRFYPDLGPMRRNGLYERSLEYLADHRSNIAAVRMLESQYASIPIAVGRPYTYYFSMPRLGYVKAPLRGYAINEFSRPELHPAVAMFADPPTKLVLVSVPNAFYQAGAISMPTADLRTSSEEAPDDGQPARLEELYRDHLASPLVVTLVDLTTALQPQAREDWYCDHLWYDAEVARATPDVISMRATLLAASGRRDLANRLLSRAVDDCPENVEFRLAQSRVWYELGDTSAAERALEQILQTNPTEARAHFQLAIVRERQSRFDEAVALYARAVELRDSYSEAWFQLGVARMRLKDVKGAVEAFQRAVELDPLSASAHNNLGVALVRQAKFAEAERQFAEALRLAPEYDDARRHLEKLRAIKAGPIGSAAS